MQLWYLGCSHEHIQVFCPAFLFVDAKCTVCMAFIVFTILKEHYRECCCLSTYELRTVIGKIVCIILIHSSSCICIIMQSLGTLIKVVFIVHD